MASAADDRATVRKPPSLARDAVACFILFTVGNVYASATWQHYCGGAKGLQLNVRAFAATPAALQRDVAPAIESRWHRVGALDPPNHRANGDDTATACSSDVSGAPRLLAPEQAEVSGAPRLLTPEQAEVSGAPRLLAPEQAEVSGANLATPGPLCPQNMVLVDGLHCPNPLHECLDYLSVERDRCRSYVASSPCIGESRPLRFCIDEFEYPNRRGMIPMVWVSYREASERCSALGKRLCTSREWELACEGPERLPYATGYLRDPDRCNFDRPNIVADQDALSNPSTRDAEFARVDQREASGARPSCVSYFGVFDMTGNVDEWVTYERGHYQKPPFRSALKGGYWGRVRNRCRPTTTDHNEWHSGYQAGFRCCADAAPGSSFGSQPAVTTHAATQPAATQPAATQPAATTYAEPVATQPAATRHAAIHSDHTAGLHAAMHGDHTAGLHAVHHPTSAVGHAAVFDRIADR